MKKIKIIFAAISVFLVLSLAAGCNSPQNDSPESLNSDTVTSTALSSQETESESSSSKPESAEVSVSSKEAESKKEVSSKESQSRSVSNSVSNVTPSKNSEENKYPYYLSVNRKQNTVTVYKKDNNGKYTVPVKAMVCSCGKNGATPKGTYTTQNKYDWRALVGGVYGQYATRITGQILFHSVPYFKRDKSTLEYEEYNKLGTAASLGCVRLSVIDAKWIYDNCAIGTTVNIYDGDEKLPLGKPSAQKIDVKSPNRGWDPTDPDKNNPWNKKPDVPAPPQPSETPSTAESSEVSESSQSEETTAQ
ncbi:MAG: L,D-transpeptidase [Clostridiales bacterium]|nr:L,D-transpeptidase [Candidatus Equinaster intestinalis]